MVIHGKVLLFAILGLSTPTHPVLDITRADLARVVASIDARLARLDLPPEELSRISEEFDVASLAFLRGGLRQSLVDFARLDLSLQAGLDPEEISSELAASSLRLTPAASWGGGTTDLTLEPLFSVPELAGVTLPVAVFDHSRAPAAPRELTRTRVSFDEGGMASEVRLEGVEVLEAGVDRALLSLSPRAPVSSGLVSYSRLDRSPEELRAELLTGVDGVNPEPASLVRVFQERAELLRDRPSPNRTHEFLIDPREHYEELAEELLQLQDGRDPYVERPGHLWRPIVVGRRALPVRLYAPGSVVESDEPVALVVALHGAGGDESMFVELEGLIDLVGMAEEREFLLVSPRTPDWFYGTRSWTALVDEMDRCYGVDRERVFVLGHSMGAAAASTLTRAGARPLAGAGFLAGMQEPRPREGVKMVFVAGADDPLIREGAIEAAARSCSGEFRSFAGLGHTLCLGPASEWILDQFGILEAGR